MPGRVGAHRRVQSTLPVSMGAFGGTMGQFGAPMPGLGMDNQQGIPRGHGRRHSVNVLNKGAGPNASISYPNPYAQQNQDGFDDGFTAPPPMQGAHSRQASRADTSWRMSKLVNLILSDVS